MCLLNSAMSSHLASHPVHLHTPVSETNCFVRNVERKQELNTLTVEGVLIQVWGNASILVLLVGVVVVRDVHLPVLHLLLLPPEQFLGGNRFSKLSHHLVVSFEFCSLLPSSSPAKPPEPP